VTAKTTPTWPGRVAGVAGFLLGALVIIVALAGWRLPRGAGYAGSDVYLIAQPTGELAVAPTGSVLSTRDLSPGEHASGGFGIVNQTGKKLAVQLRVLPDSTALDGLLRIEVRADGRPLFSGQLGSLRRWTSRSAMLPVRAHARLTLRIWFPATAPSGWQGQVETVPIELRAAPATGDA
jgi:hypothetical protein